ncbi:MAG: spore coat protein [Sphingomonas sanxanigenens]|uniref:Spore coat protein n=1 Tax=Sphingomonas sanxanigenens TaxID=397260 RepID=A0A2W5A6X0_9SPHN|nr:MAG: spore coat protein [Sphingomonas sanxanigenens]
MRRHYRALALILAAITPQAVLAQISGSIDATINLTTGCIINGQSADDGATAVDFGSIDFGSHNTLFTSADGEVMGGAAGIAIQCSPGVVPTLSFGTGQHDGQGSGAGNRAMAHASSAGHYVNYGLYSDAGRNSLIAINGSFNLASDGSAQTVRIYGRAYGATGLVSGTYTDNVLVTLAF